MPKKPKKLPIVSSSSWSEHKSQWSNCTSCTLCKTRSKTILGTGKMPCDVLLLGDSPGTAEDTVGRPFVGPAGSLLIEMCERAQELAEAEELRLFYSNMLSCVPFQEETLKTKFPEEEEIKSCAPRLNDLIQLLKPKGIVMVGRLSGKFAPIYCDWDFDYSVEIIHPAAILRADDALKGITAQKTILLLEEFFTKVSNGPSSKEKKKSRR